MKNKKLRYCLGGLGGCLLFAVTAVTTGAFLTDSTEELQNRMLPGCLMAELTEPDWNPENGSHMLPGSSALKNPVGENTGTLPAKLFMEVEVPVKTISLVDPETGRKTQPEETELVTFQNSEKWVPVRKEKEGQKVTYVFGYTETVLPFQKTEALFDSIRIVPYLEGELDPEETFRVPVKLHAMQENFCEEGSTPEEFFQKYLKQQEEKESDAI